MKLETHDLLYDGRVNDLYKIYLLHIFLSIVTLGIYHFWGKTRKRRYITSAVQLHHDRFEYTGYASELLLGFIMGLFTLFLFSLPLSFSIYNLINHQNDPALIKTSEEEKKSYHFEGADHFKKNRLIIDFTDITHFWLVFNNDGLLFEYQSDRMEIQYFSHTSYGLVELPIIFNPRKEISILLSVLAIPIYFIFFIFYLPFMIVYASLRYRASHLRWRGIRGHLSGSSLLYAFYGLFHTFMKGITLGFWIPISDLIMLRYKANRLFFGNQRGDFHPRFKPLIIMNLATIGASLYLIGLMAAFGYWILPFLATYTPTESSIIMEFLRKIFEKGYYIIFAILLWGCYAPRYWYRATLLRERYNAFRFGNLYFACHASGYEYFKLFLKNDLIFIFTLGFGLPIIWQRRMRFIEKHLKIIGDLNHLHIQQAHGKKDTLGGGLGSLMNLEVGVI